MTLIQADAFHLPYPDKLFHACVTSPPYWGLRKYAGDQGDWSVDGHREDRRKKHGGQAEWDEYKPSTVTDYRPTCECGHEDFEPGIVLDIFGGSGTTGMVAKQLLRRWVVMDISRPYLDEQSKIRTKTGTPSKTLEGLPLFEDLE